MNETIVRGRLGRDERGELVLHRVVMRTVQWRCPRCKARWRMDEGVVAPCFCGMQPKNTSG